MMKKILFLFCLVISNLGFAQDTTTHNLNTVQVIGLHHQKLEPVTLTSFSTDSVTQYVSKRRDPFFALERMIPSIYSQSDNGQSNGYSYMRMRGLDQTRINFNLNGVPLNEMEDQGIYFSNMPGFYNYIGHISVERGIGTSKYGNTSVAGSVNMETYSMSQKFLDINSLLVSPTKGNQFSNFMWSSGIDSNGLSTQLGGTYIVNNGFKEHSGNDGGSIYYALGYFKKNNIFKVWGFSGMTHNQLAYIGVPMDSINKDYKYNANMTSDRDTFNQNLACVSWINYKNPHVTFNTTAYYENVHGHYSSFGTLFGVSSNQFGIMSNMVYQFKKNWINIGVNSNIYTRDHFGSDSSGFFYGTFSPYTNTGYKQDGIIYLKGVDINEKFNVFYDAQLRLVHFNTSDGFEKNWLFFNPRLGFKYFGKNSETYMSFGITHREPTRSDMIQQIIQSNQLFGGNSDNTILTKKYSDTTMLKPEIVSNLEVGNKFSVENLEINSNIYFMAIQNEFVATGYMDQYSGLMQKEQKTLSIRYGVEENVQLKLDKLSLYWNMNFQQSKLPNDSLTNIPFCPTFIGSFGASYRIKSFMIGLIEQGVSSMNMSISDASIMSQPYYITNGFINWKYKNMGLSLKLNNILNSKYYIPAMLDVNNTPTFYVGQTFNWSLNLNIHF
jgi:iron complex outermembrane recepter protein